MAARVDYLIVCAATCVASVLTLFSGFGLGTFVLPVFALFFPIPLAVAATALVHLCNNLFKLMLYEQHAVRSILWRFGLPAVVSAFLGAKALVALAHLPPLATYTLSGVTRTVLPVKAVVAVLLVMFAVLELVPRFARWGVAPQWLLLGGIVSGFFGGLSGHQGALRSAFLMRCRLSKEQFIGTGVVIACLVDVARLAVYSHDIVSPALVARVPLLAAATLSAVLGAWIGARWLKQVTLRAVQWIVAVMLVVIAAGLGSGWL